MRDAGGPGAALVHLAAGIGNIVLATPLLTALGRLHVIVDVLLDADYPETADLLKDWSLVRRVYTSANAARIPLEAYRHLVPAVPPFYWPRYTRYYARLARVVTRPPDERFYENEQAYYVDFARRLGYAETRDPNYCLPIAAGASAHASAETLVIAPGSKTGEMAAKRWGGFAELAEQFADVALVGTRDDLGGGGLTSYPRHVRSFIDVLGLRDTVALMASAGVVVGNDSGLSHAAAATGTPTVMLFGPTPHRTLGPLPPNVTVLRSGMTCEPCWFSERLRACGRRVDCLSHISIARVVETVRRLAAPGLLPPHRRDGITVTAVATEPKPAVAGVSGAPLVSCTMPTSDRRAFIPAAVSRFLEQDYQQRELIVLDDGVEGIKDLLPNDPRIRYERLGRRLALGAKRNLACECARGEFIVHWDDDDWMAPWRLSYQLQAMIDHPEADVSGLERVLFYDPALDRAWEYVWVERGRRWVAGGTMCYRKVTWKARPFAEVREGEDTRFVWSTPPHRILPLSNNAFYVARVHPSNTSRKHPTDSRWRAYPVEQLRRVAAGWEALQPVISRA